MKKALFLLADGFEEVEAITPMDALSRAGVDVTTCGVTGKIVKSAHNVSVDTDITIDELEGEFDLIYLPGGIPGSTNLKANKKVCELIKKQNEENKLVAAICAAPAVVLGPCGLLDGKNATCYPGWDKEFPGFKFSDEGVVIDGNIVTAKAAGWAWEMGFALISLLFDEEKRVEVMNTVYYRI